MWKNSAALGLRGKHVLVLRTLGGGRAVVVGVSWPETRSWRPRVAAAVGGCASSVGWRRAAWRP